MNRLQLFVAFVAALLVASLAGTASAWRIYALSNNLDVWQGGRWSTIPLTFGNTTGTFFVDPPIAPTQVGQDRTGDVFLTALNGVPGRRPFVTTLKLDSATNAWAGTSFFIGRWGFDSANNFYSVNRFSPAPPVRNPIVKMASADYSDTSGGYIGHATATSDITPFRRGNAMVLVGNFTQVWNGNNSNPVEARNVALYDTRTGRWSAMGDGIPSPPSRIVSNGLQLVALVEPSTLWRWNGSNRTWRAYPLNLTSSRGDPYISDLDFGNEKLFLVGNFDRVNGVGVRNVSMLNFGVGGALTVKGIGIGLPGGSKTSIYARSSSQVFVGGSTNGWKVVYEWRKGRAVPWDRIGDLGFSPGTAPVVGLTVVN